MKAFLYRKKIGYISLILSVLSLYVFRPLLGNAGLGYLAGTYLIAVMVWFLLGDGTSDVVSRLVRLRLSKGQKNAALDILSSASVIIFINAILGAVLVGVLNYYFFDISLKLPKGRFLGLYLIVFFFFRMINEYLTAYNLSASNDKAVCIAVVLRPLIRLISGYPLMIIMSERGEKVGNLLIDEDFEFIYGVSGIFVAFCLAEFLIFVFLLIVRLGSNIRASKSQSSYSSNDSFGTVFINLWKRRLGNIIYGLSITVILFSWIISAENESDIGIAMNIIIVPFALSSFVSLFDTASCETAWLGAFRRKEKGNSRAFFDYGIHIAVITSVFMASFFSGVSKLYTRLMLPDISEGFPAELILAVVSSVLFSVSAFSDRLCAARDDRVPRIISSLVSCLLGMLSVRLCIGAGMNALRSLSVSILIYSVSEMIIWYITTYFRMNLVYDPLRNILIPVISGAVMAIIILIFTNFASAHLGNLFTLLICIPISLIVYNAILLMLRNYSEAEINLMPFGNAILSLGQILRVM